MEKELDKILQEYEEGNMTLITLKAKLLLLFSVSGRFYSDKEIEKIKYLSFLQGTVDGDIGDE